MMRESRVKFGSPNARLSGTLVEPSGRPVGTALFAHCFTCTQASLAATRLSRQLAERGLAVLRFDFTGLGESEGEFAASDFSRNVEDLVKAADWLSAQIAPPSVLIGHSLGGAAAIVAATRLTGLKALVTIGAPSDAAHVLASIEGDLAAIEVAGSGPVSIGGRPFRISDRFLQAAREGDVLSAMHELPAAKLVCHAPRDAIVGIDNATRLFQAARHPKSFLSLENADHLLTDPDDARWLGDVIAAWVSRHLDRAKPEAGLAVTGVVKVTSAAQGFAVDIQAGRHRWIADEPRSVGGTDGGPTPYDLLLASLGACTAMTVRMVATRENIPLDSVEVDLRHERDHHADCDHCAEESARVQAIHRTITIAGAMEPNQRERLKQVVNRCPVHRTLTGGLHIHDTFGGEID